MLCIFSISFIFRLDDTLKITRAAFGEIGADRLSNACAHVENVIKKMKEADNYNKLWMHQLTVDLRDATTDTANEGGSTTDTASETDMHWLYFIWLSIY